MAEFNNRYRGRPAFNFKCACCLAYCRFEGTPNDDQKLYCPRCWKSPWRTAACIPEFGVDERNNEECVICMASLAGKKAIRLPCCKNYYCASDDCHAGGIRRWLTANNTCPACRYKYHGVDAADRKERFDEMKQKHTIKIDGDATCNELHKLEFNQLLAFHHALLGVDGEHIASIKYLSKEGKQSTRERLVKQLLKSGLYELSLETALRAARQLLLNVPRLQLWPSVYATFENDDKVCCVCNLPHEESSIVSVFPCGHFCHSGARSCLSAPAMQTFLEINGGFPCPHPLCATRLKVATGDGARKPITVRREHLSSLGLEIIRMFAQTLNISFARSADLNTMVTTLFRSRYYKCSDCDSECTVIPHSLLDKFVGGSTPRSQNQLDKLERRLIRERMGMTSSAGAGAGAGAGKASALSISVAEGHAVSSPPVLTEAEKEALEAKVRSIDPFHELPSCFALLQSISGLDKGSFMPQLGQNLVQCLKQDLQEQEEEHDYKNEQGGNAPLSVAQADLGSTAAAATTVVDIESSSVVSLATVDVFETAEKMNPTITTSASIPTTLTPTPTPSSSQQSPVSIPVLIRALITFAEAHKKIKWTEYYWTEDAMYGAAVKFLLSELPSEEQRRACVMHLVGHFSSGSTLAALIARGICKYEDCEENLSVWRGLTASDIRNWRTNELARLEGKKTSIESVGFAYQTDLAQCEERLKMLKAEMARLENQPRWKPKSKVDEMALNKLLEEEKSSQQYFAAALEKSRRNRQQIENEMRLIDIDRIDASSGSGSCNISSIEQRERNAIVARVTEEAERREAEEDNFCAAFKRILDMRKRNGERLSPQEKSDEKRYEKIQAFRVAQLKSKLKKQQQAEKASTSVKTAS